MTDIKQAISTALRNAAPNASDADVDLAVKKLIEEIGVEDVDDLKDVREQDLAPYFKPISARKILAVWSQSGPLTSTVTAASSAEHEDDDVSIDSYQEGRPVPVPYVLCRFPDDIQRLLDAADPALATDSTYRNKIRKAICADMAQYTLCPSPADYANVCSALIRKYAFLSDKVNRINIKNASPYHTWKKSIRDDFKNRRRPLTTVDTINAAKEKFGRKRPRDVAEVDEIEAVRRRQSDVPPLVPVDASSNGEDANTIEDHISAMKIQMAKQKPNMDVINERMVRTLLYRTQLIESSTIGVVLDRFPALCLEEQIFKEFNLRFQKECDSQFNRFWTPERVTTILLEAKKKKLTLTFLSQVGSASTVDINQQRFDCALLCLPAMLREHEFSKWVVFDKDVSSLHPCVHVTTGSGGLFDYATTQYRVYLDKQFVFKATNLANAIMGMFALYFICGVHYPKCLIKTYTFLSAHVMGFVERQLPTVQVLFNKLSK